MQASNFYIEKVDLSKPLHCKQLLLLLNEYMEDEMGAGKPMNPGLSEEIIEGLQKYPSYIGFFIREGDEFLGLANCNSMFSTFQAAPLLNIHDFIIRKKSRKLGAGQFLLEGITGFAKQEGFCRVNLEVRYDNIKAMNLYRKTGFGECNPPMYFWEKGFNGK